MISMARTISVAVAAEVLDGDDTQYVGCVLGVGVGRVAVGEHEHGDGLAHGEAVEHWRAENAPLVQVHASRLRAQHLLQLGVRLRAASISKRSSTTSSQD